MGGGAGEEEAPLKKPAGSEGGAHSGKPHLPSPSWPDSLDFYALRLAGGKAGCFPPGAKGTGGAQRPGRGEGMGVIALGLSVLSNHRQ